MRTSSQYSGCEVYWSHAMTDQVSSGISARGISRADLKELGEGLDVGQAGLVVIAATDVGQRVEDAMNAASKVVKKEIKADQKQLEKEVKEASEE